MDTEIMPNTEMKQWTFEDWMKLARYEGPVDPKIDQDRLMGQTREIHDLMIDGKRRTLAEIEDITGFPQSSISAQLRHLRKPRFGGFIVNKYRRYEDKGVWEYELIKREIPASQGEDKTLNKSIGVLNPLPLAGNN
jgi:hypothetical protein